MPCQEIKVNQRQRSSVEAVTALAWCDNRVGEQHLIRVLSSPGESTDCNIIQRGGCFQSMPYSTSE